ncbi:RnfH family protein [Methylocaldum sp. MU1018]
MKVEVAYAKPDTQIIIAVDVPDNATAEAAIAASGLLERFPEIDLAKNKIGIFGKVCPAGHPIKPGDRVEIYRPLIADPKEARRARAAKK